MHFVLPDVERAQTDIPFGDPQGGFSLLELSLVLAVMGVVAASGLSLMTSRLAQAKERVTQEHQELLFRTIAGYTLAHMRLPCPSATLSGVARENCQTPSDATGYIPFQTLGIPSKIAKDGWGKLMHFGVHPDMTHTHGENARLEQLEILCRQAQARVSITSPQGEVQHLENDPIAVVVFSQGAGHGQPPSSSEALNRAPSLSFVDTALRVTPQDPHRHILNWRTRDTLLSHHAHFSCSGFLANRIQAPVARSSFQQAPTPNAPAPSAPQEHPWGGDD